VPALNFPIPLQILNVGTSTFGPANVDNDVSLATLAIDRTVKSGNVNGFNAQPATTKATLTLEQSNDGVNWFFRGSGGIIGGTYFEDGVIEAESNVSVPLEPGTGRRVRGSLTVVGARVAVAGSVTVT
jgi:hypothetical protein